MNVGALPGRRTRSAGDVSPRKKREALSKREIAALREMDQAWLGLALYLLRHDSLSAPFALSIASAGAGEGKTINCLGLSVAIAKETDAQVLMVECDFGRPGVADLMQLDPKPGLAEHLMSGASIEDALRRTRLPNLKILVAGGADPEDEGSIESWTDLALSRLRRRLPEILLALKGQHSYILLDMPPLFSSVYSKDMVRAADGVLLAAREGVTTMESMSRAVEEIGEELLLSAILVGGNSYMPPWVGRLLPE